MTSAPLLVKSIPRIPVSRETLQDTILSSFDTIGSEDLIARFVIFDNLKAGILRLGHGIAKHILPVGNGISPTVGSWPLRPRLRFQLLTLFCAHFGLNLCGMCSPSDKTTWLHFCPPPMQRFVVGREFVLVAPSGAVVLACVFPGKRSVNPGLGKLSIAS